ncbi:LacI family DNA-binding transcriptional regulator [Tepidibacillus marianensis]|uniref:LacI family DNA-binding transcriptional regulator n=1 Tax=Tepidibacillus marianensis TaxID=3131995 RepID=UPI0030D60267
MATIKDVSNLAGISIGTVSRYLNGYKVKKENETKIKEAINQLDFKVNLMARGLKTNKTYTIGVLVPSITDIFSNQVIEGMEEVLDEQNYSIIVCSSRYSLKTEKEKIAFLKDKRVDGVIIMPVSDEGEHIRELLDENIPVILIDRLLDGVECDAVICDNVNGSYRAVEQLISLGHRRIGIVAGPSNVFTARERLNGYIRALSDYNIPIDESLITYSEYKKGSGVESFNKLINLEERPTAIFATNYETTITGMRYLIEKGIKIGDEISLFGYDNTEVFQMLSPSITSVVQPMREIGDNAAKLILKRIENEERLYPVINRLKTKIIVGNSVKKIIE